MVDWSWELLTRPEREVLARLSAFAGGFALAAAEAVAASPDVPAAEVAGLLGALVDKSLVQFDHTGGPGRYRMLETVREYAAEHLEAQGPAAAEDARMAHRDYFLALAEAATPQLRAHDQAAWLDQLMLSEHTVHRHLANILRKLDLSSRAAAAAWGVRTGLV